MKEQLNNITRELQEIKNKELTQQEKKENLQLYKKILKKTIKETIEQETETQLQQGETIKDIYNYLIVNDDTIKDNITEELLHYKKEVRREIAQAEYQDPKKNIKKYKILINYPFKDFDIAEDVDNLYYTILKNIYNKYTLKNNIDNNKTIEELESLFYSYYKNYGYKIARKTLFDEYNKNVIIEATDKNNQEYVKKNYTKILKQVDNNYKIANNEEIKQQEQLKKYQYTQSKPIIKKKKTFYAGSIVAGFIAGLLKVSKK